MKYPFYQKPLRQWWHRDILQRKLEKEKA